MKKIVMALMALVFVESSAYSTCTTKCITRDPFSGRCLIKTKVCGVSIKGIQEELEKGWHKLESAWHDLYATAIPEHLRDVINNYPVTIIGSAFGGVQGHVFGQWFDHYITRAVLRLERTKKVILQFEDWKSSIIWEGYVIATGRQLAAVGTSKEMNMPMLDGIDKQYEEFLDCMGHATDPVGARQYCLQPLEFEAMRLVYKL